MLHKLLKAALLIALLTLAGCAGDWRTASREPAGKAPPAATTPEAVIQVYGAPRGAGVAGLLFTPGSP